VLYIIPIVLGIIIGWGIETWIAKFAKSILRHKPVESFNDTFLIELGFCLIPLVDNKNGAPFLEKIITEMRQEIITELTVTCPPIRIIDNMHLKPQEYLFFIEGIEKDRNTIKYISEEQDLLGMISRIKCLIKEYLISSQE
jgi:flagellar biosynthesis component FlhA